MNREAFSLLAMGFTGQKAMTFKLALLAEFVRMEGLLRSRAIEGPRQETEDDEISRVFLKVHRRMVAAETKIADLLEPTIKRLEVANAGLEEAKMQAEDRADRAEGIIDDWSKTEGHFSWRFGANRIGSTRKDTRAFCTTFGVLGKGPGVGWITRESETWKDGSKQAVWRETPAGRGFVKDKTEVLKIPIRDEHGEVVGIREQETTRALLTKGGVIRLQQLVQTHPHAPDIWTPNGKQPRHQHSLDLGHAPDAPPDVWQQQQMDLEDDE